MSKQCLLLCLGLACAAVGLVGAEEQQDLACEDVGKVPLHDQCHFVRTHCESDSRVPYQEWYYCKALPGGLLARAGFMIALFLFLPLLFTLLGDTAELYFSPIMTHVSQSIPKLRPRFAGVTFVAIGNGAPDLSANISAIRNGNVLLSAGALTGAAMFVQCIVASEVMRATRHGAVKCRGATLRDLAMYCVALLLVLGTFAYGQVTRLFIAGACLIYAAYVVWVFLGDEWHERGRPEARHMWRSFREGVMASWRDRQPSLRDGQLPWAAVDTAGDSETGLGIPLLRPEESGAIRSDAAPHAHNHNGDVFSRASSAPLSTTTATAISTRHHGSHQNGHHSRLIDAKTYRTMVWADLGSPDENDDTSASNAGRDSSGSLLPYASLPLAGTAAAVVRRRKKRVSGTGSGAAARLRRTGVQSLSASLLELSAPAASDMQSNSGALAPAAMTDRASSGRTASTSLTYFQDRRTLPHTATAGSQGSSSNKLPDQVGLVVPPDEALLRFGSLPVQALPHDHADITDTGASQADLMQQQQQHAAGGGVIGEGDGHRLQGLGGSHASLQVSEPWAGPGSVTAGDDPDRPQSGTLERGISHDDPDRTQLRPWTTPLGWTTPPESLAGDGFDKEGRGYREGMEEDGEYEDEEEEEEAAVQRTWWQRVQHELTMGNSAEWEELPENSVRRRFRAVTFPLLLPVYALLRLTIPFVDPASYSRRWLVATMLCAPPAVAVYLDATGWSQLVIALGVGAALALAVWYFTLGEELLPDWEIGGAGGFALGPALFAVMGFFMGVAWIDTLASEVVGAIQLMAAVLGAPAGVMGLTLLAWGSSLGDFFGNPAMARRGQSSMALTACFAGPLFNMLASMSLGFGSFFAKHRVAATPVQLRPEVLLGGAFLLTYNAVLALTGLLNRNTLPPRFYLFARAWYCLYFVLACVFGLWWADGS